MPLITQLICSRVDALCRSFLTAKISDAAAWYRSLHRSFRAHSRTVHGTRAAPGSRSVSHVLSGSFCRLFDIFVDVFAIPPISPRPVWFHGLGETCDKIAVVWIYHTPERWRISDVKHFSHLLWINQWWNCSSAIAAGALNSSHWLYSPASCIRRPLWSGRWYSCFFCSVWSDQHDRTHIRSHLTPYVRFVILLCLIATYNLYALHIF